MRSVAVVFPASMCAMIPMFRQRFRGMVRATAVSSLRALQSRGFDTSTIQHSGCPGLDFETWETSTHSAQLPAVVSKGLVGLRHAVHVFLLLHGRAAPVGRIQQL